MISVSAELAGAVIVNAVVVGVSWGFLRRDVTATRRDVVAIKKALGLEPVDGRIESAFVPPAESRLMEEGVTERLKGCEDRVGDCEHRLTAMEARKASASRRMGDALLPLP